MLPSRRRRRRRLLLDLEEGPLGQRRRHRGEWHALLECGQGQGQGGRVRVALGVDEEQAQRHVAHLGASPSLSLSLLSPPSLDLTLLLARTQNRKPRLRLRPSTTASVYRNNPHLPPTPAPSSASFPGAATGAAPTTARRPKRGESIVMRSMNGSPLGEFIASEDEGGESRSSSDEGEGASDDDDDEWDLLERNEASKVEHQSASKGKKRAAPPKSKSKASSSASSSKAQPPTSASFIVALPADAPSFNEVKRLWVEQMQANLRNLDVGEAEKRRLEEALLASVPGL